MDVNKQKKKLMGKAERNDVKVGFGKMKTWNVCFFSNACSILELMLCNWNFAKLVYLTLVSSNCRALALKLSEHLKKQT